MPQPDALHVEEITTTAALESVAPEWLALWYKDPNATPFQSPGWLLPWWKHIGQGDLLTLAIRAGDALVAVLPLYIYTEQGSDHGAGMRKLFPLGIATTDYLDGTFLPNFADAATQLALAHLQKSSAAWDVFEFPQLRTVSPLTRIASSAALSTGEACVAIAFKDDERELGQNVPSRMMRNLRYYQVRADALGDVEFACATPANLDQTFEALVELHRCRWERRQQSGVLSAPEVAAMHREAIRHLLGMDCLRMYSMRLSGAMVAVVYAITDRADRPHRRTYSYLGGFNPALNNISPGTLLIGYAVRQALEEGCHAFDFLRGEEGYKRLWGATDRETLRLELPRAVGAVSPDAAA